MISFIAMFSVGEQTRRHLLLASLRTDCRKADRGHPGGQEPEEDGCWRPLR